MTFPEMQQTVATFYQFVELPDYEALGERLKTQCEESEVLGTVILAEEGINATIAGPEKGIAEVMAFLRSDPRLTDMEHRETTTDRITFHRLRIIKRPEIVTLGDPTVNPNEAVGKHVDPKDWNALISDPEVILIDTRNSYEVEVGTFQGAIDPKTETFGQWDEYVKKEHSEDKGKRIAMFCTGGIRCEKASALMLKEGFQDVRQLQGGVLGYFEEMGGAHWDGDCFVFDRRVAVDPELNVTGAEVCFACREPLTQEELDSPLYVPAISCPYCIQ